MFEEPASLAVCDTVELTGLGRTGIVVSRPCMGTARNCCPLFRAFGGLALMTCFLTAVQAKGLPSPTATARISGIAFTSYPDHATVEIYLSGNAAYRFARLGNPERLYFDFPHTRLDSLFAIPQIPEGDAWLQRIRMAEKEPGTVRVVLDLKVPVTSKVSPLLDPPGMRVELWKSEAASAPPNKRLVLPERDQKDRAKPLDAPEGISIEATQPAPVIPVAMFPQEPALPVPEESKPVEQAMPPLSMIPTPPGAAFSLSGVVIDPSGAVVTGAGVSLKSSRRMEQIIATDATGTFRFERIPAGAYELVVEKPGFKPAKTRVRVGGRARAPLQIALTLAELRESVTVGGEDGTVSAEAAENLDVIKLDRRALDSLPTLGQDVVAAVEKLLDPASTGTGGATVVVDGMETTEKGVSPSAIQEVKINQNPYSAEFSRPGHGRIEIVTKAGSSSFHGGLKFGFRDFRLDARDAFAVERPQEQRRDWDGYFSGPLGHSKKTSFLINMYREEQDSNSVIYALTLGGPVRENVPKPVRATFVAGRINRQVGKNNTLGLRYEFWGDTAINEGVGGFNLPEVASNTSNSMHHIYYSHRTVASHHLINDFSLRGGSHESLQRAQQRGVSKIVVLDAFTGGSAQADSHVTENHVQLTDMLSWSRGRHFLKTGIAIPDISRRGTNDQTDFGGTFYFSSLSDYALGRPFSFIRQQGDSHLAFWQKELGLFVQDDIRVRPNFSIALGLRYDWQNHLPDHNNLAPRFSFAFAPQRNRKTVFRGGAGIFYDRTGDGPIADILRFDGRRLLRIILSDPGYPDPLADGGSFSVPPTSIVRFASDLRSPYNAQYSLGAERQLQKSVTFTANYIGMRGIKLFRSRDINAPPAPLYLRRADPSIAVLRQIESSAHLESHALRLGLRGNVTRFFNGAAEYTLGRAYNDTSGIASFPANQYDLSGEWSRADFDERHRFHVYGTVSAGRFFKLGLIASVNSGRPYSLTTGRDDNRDSFAYDRPPGVPRNSQAGPGAANLDVRWSRDWFLSASRKEKGPSVTLAVDAFNVFNHVNFTPIIGNLSSPFFGRPVGSRPPRRLQVSAGLKY